VFCGASEGLTVGQLELKQFLAAFQVGCISQHGTVECLHPRADIVLAQALNCRLFSGDGVEHLGISGDTRSRATHTDVGMLATFADNQLRPMVLRHLLFAVRIPPMVGHPPEQVFLLLPVFRVAEAPEQRGLPVARRKLGSEDLKAPALQGAGFVFHIYRGSHTQGLTRIFRKCNKFAQFVLKVWVS